MQATRKDLKEQVATFVGECREGATARDVVQTVAQQNSAPEEDVQRALRILVNRGDLEVGAKLRLFRK